MKHNAYSHSCLGPSQAEPIVFWDRFCPEGDVERRARCTGPVRARAPMYGVRPKLATIESGYAMDQWFSLRKGGFDDCPAIIAMGAALATIIADQKPTRCIPFHLG